MATRSPVGTAQRAMGTHPLRILVRTILPNVLPPLLVQMSLVVASAMVIESGLSFLGLGVVPPLGLGLLCCAPERRDPQLLLFIVHDGP